MAAKGAELTRGGSWFQAIAHLGERAGKRVSPYPAAPSQNPGSIHQEANGAYKGGGKGRWHERARLRCCLESEEDASVSRPEPFNSWPRPQQSQRATRSVDG